MNFPHKKFPEALLFLCLIVLNISCSKDSDLLADYVSPGGPDGSLRRYVVDDAFFLRANSSIRMDVLSNDTFPDRGEVRISRTSSPANGSVSINEDNTLTYASDEPSESTDTFTYTTEVVNEDATVTTETGTVTVTLTEDKPQDVTMGELKAFPGAEGFGKYTTGGRGGEVLAVTNLNDSGTGSLREAINASGPRTVVFMVSGYINLNSPLTIKNGDITIAGQTAVRGGITLRRGGSFSDALLIVNDDNVIIRGLRFRIGPAGIECCGDNLRVSNANNVVIDHCSLSWSIDESLSITGSSNVTISNSIISESLENATHQEGPHSKAVLVSGGATRISFFNNLFAHNADRNPLIGGSSPNGPGEAFEIVNQVIYNWDNFGIVFNGPIKTNIINTVSIAGNQTSPSRYSIALNTGVSAYVRGNYNRFRTSQSASEWDAIGCERCGDYMTESAPADMQSDSPFDYPLKNYPTLSRSEIISTVMAEVGPFTDDAADARIKADVQSGTGNVINNPGEVGGYPELKTGTSYLDTDKDGISDEWEVANGLDHKSLIDGSEDTNGDDYDNLETYLHYLTLD